MKKLLAFLCFIIVLSVFGIVTIFDIAFSYSQPHPKIKFVFNFGVHSDKKDIEYYKTVITKTKPDIILTELAFSTKDNEKMFEQAISDYRQSGNLPDGWNEYGREEITLLSETKIPFSFPEIWTTKEAQTLRSKHKQAQELFSRSMLNWLEGNTLESIVLMRKFLSNSSQVLIKRQDHISNRLNKNIYQIIRNVDPRLSDKHEIVILVRMGILHRRIFDLTKGSKEIWYDFTPYTWGPSDDLMLKVISGQEITDLECARAMMHEYLDFCFSNYLSGATSRQYAGIFASELDLNDFTRLSKYAKEKSVQNKRKWKKSGNVLISSENIFLPTPNEMIIVFNQCLKQKKFRSTIQVEPKENEAARVVSKYYSKKFGKYSSRPILVH